jgi:hypothetical protein
MRKIVLAMTGVFVLAQAAHLGAQSLKGSHATMERQNSVAHNLDYTFLETARDVRHFIEAGLLVPVHSTKALRLSEGVSFSYARPAVKLFAERLASQYQRECGERMVVTSLVRPLSRQPWNASELSVHPAGMAVDIRVSDRRSCRNWLAEALVGLEAKGVIDATREHFPAHFHVAVFPAAYERYVAKTDAPTSTRLASAAATKPAKPVLKIAEAAQPTYASILPMPSSHTTTTHKVRPGESLWSIAKQHGVSVAALKNANDLRKSRIVPGQVLAIPTPRSSEAD